MPDERREWDIARYANMSIVILTQRIRFEFYEKAQPKETDDLESA